MELTKKEKKEYQKRQSSNNWRVNVMLDPETWLILQHEEKLKGKNRSELIRHAIGRTYKDLETKYIAIKKEKARISYRLSKLSQQEQDIVKKFKDRLGNKWQFVQLEIDEKAREELEITL